MGQVAQVAARMESEVDKVVYGAYGITRRAFVALLSRGHLLLEGLPGTGKTLFAKAFSCAAGLEMKRVQCTPDLMPADVVGANIFDFRTQTFTLTKGPVFTECLLADEINRTPPKTQSALLEAMQERSVTIDGTTHKLPDGFFVLATQNPLEHEGTYPLPEAQLDRFLFKMVASFPPEEVEKHTVLAHSAGGTLSNPASFGVERVLNASILTQLRQDVAQVHLEENIAQYIVSLARSSREHRAVSMGLSTRAATLLATASRAQAACDGRSYVIPDDVKMLLPDVARHRLILNVGSEMEGTRVEDVVNDLRERISPPA